MGAGLAEGEAMMYRRIQRDPADVQRGQELRRWREDLRLTRREAAGLLGIKHGTLGKWERGDAAPGVKFLEMWPALLRELAKRRGEFK